MFTERLKRIHDRLEGALAISLVGSDGIPVASHNTSSVDTEALAAELVTLVRAISDDHGELAVGRVRHFAVTTDRYALMVGALVAGYYLLVVMSEGGSLGRARWELRRATLDFEADLI